MRLILPTSRIRFHRSSVRRSRTASVDCSVVGSPPWWASPSATRRRCRPFQASAAPPSLDATDHLGGRQDRPGWTPAQKAEAVNELVLQAKIAEKAGDRHGHQGRADRGGDQAQGRRGRRRRSRSADPTVGSYQTRIDDFTNASFRGARLSQVSLLLTANSADDFLDSATTLDRVADDTQQTLDQALAARTAAKQARAEAVTAADAAVAAQADADAAQTAAAAEDRQGQAAAGRPDRAGGRVQEAVQPAHGEGAAGGHRGRRAGPGRGGSAAAGGGRSGRRGAAAGRRRRPRPSRPQQQAAAPAATAAATSCGTAGRSRRGPQHAGRVAVLRPPRPPSPAPRPRQRSGRAQQPGAGRGAGGIVEGRHRPTSTARPVRTPSTAPA